MSFNTNYILPGDDKNQIIGKVNYNFSQILSNSMGLPGQSGIVGATGIIGQVGKDGASGPTGTRASEWYFQQNQPFGDVPFSESPLQNFDVWVDTSPGSTGGPNRVYQYNVNQFPIILDHPFWDDTDSNFAIDGNFTLLQGVSGPGEVTEKNAVIIGGIPSETTFVFTDREVSEANANPTYSKIVVESDPSATAELPLFSLGKTFYSEPDLPSFFWQNSGDNYDIRFSSGAEISIQSQATGSYSSTGATASMVSNGINWNSATTASIIGPSGISINSGIIGTSSLNLQLQTGGASFSVNEFEMETSSTVDYSLSVAGTLLDSQTGPRTVLGYSGLYGGTNQRSLALEVSGGSIFSVGNPPPSSQINGTPASLFIGYPGSTGISGGTGANIVKSFQSITDPASSKVLINGNLNNYIPVTPSSDVILITPNPTGPIISDGNRINRIWLLLTGIRTYVEAENASCIDIFMNSSSIYAFGGVIVPISLSSPGAPFTITDSGGTIPGATGGCRHIRLNFFGSSFSRSVSSRSNNFFNIQSFSSGFSSAAMLPYTPAGFTVPFS